MRQSVKEKVVLQSLSRKLHADYEEALQMNFFEEDAEFSQEYMPNPRAKLGSRPPRFK